MSKTTIDNFLNNTNPTNLHEVFANQINDFLSNKISFSEAELKIFTIKVLVMAHTLKQEYYNFLDNVSPEEMLHTIALYSTTPNPRIASNGTQGKFFIKL